MVTKRNGILWRSNMNPCVVIQGRGDHLNTIIHNYNPDNTIISTWKDVSPVEGYISIHNDLLPRIHGNLNLQAFSTHQGCLKAKDMGYDYVLKVRSDISIKDIDSVFASFTPGLEYLNKGKYASKS